MPVLRSSKVFGDGTFLAPLTSAGGSFNNGVAVASGFSGNRIAEADIDGDGNLDFVVASDGDNEARVFLGNGDGTFADVGSFGDMTTTNAISLVDLDGDGNLDLIRAGSGGGAPVGSDFEVLLGNGDGSFDSSIYHSSIFGIDPDNLGFGDFNGDGNVDIVFSSPAQGATNQRFGVYLGNGDGTFNNYTTFRTADRGTGVDGGISVADIDGDGNLDAAIGTYGGLEVMYGLGDGTFVEFDLEGAGTFQDGVSYSAGTTVSDVVSTDFNGDGRADLVVADAAAAGVKVLMGNQSAGGDGTFNAPVSYGTGIYSDVFLTQLSGSTTEDLVAGTNLGEVHVFEANSDGSFDAPLAYSTGVSGVVSSITVQDVSGDGINDIVAVHEGENRVSVLLGNAGGTFQAPTTYMLAGDVAVSSDTLSVGESQCRRKYRYCCRDG